MGEEFNTEQFIQNNLYRTIYTEQFIQNLWEREKLQGINVRL